MTTTTTTTRRALLAAVPAIAAGAAVHASDEDRPETEARRLYRAWIATENRANEEGDSNAVTEANRLAMELVRAPVSCTADLALMTHTLLYLDDAYLDRWDVLRERLAKFV